MVEEVDFPKEVVVVHHVVVVAVLPREVVVRLLELLELQNDLTAAASLLLLVRWVVQELSAR